MRPVEQVFMCLSVVCISSLGRCLFRSFVYILTEWFVFLVFSFKRSLYILDNHPLSDTFCKYFLPICSHLYIPFAVSFTEQKFLILMKSDVACFLMDRAFFGAVVKISLPNPRSPKFSLMLSSSYFAF